MTGDDYRSHVTMLPEHMRESILQWIEAPMPPKLMGHFLRALLSNDLMEAFARADDQNAADLHRWVDYLYNYAPSECYGSREKMERWYDKHPCALRPRVEAPPDAG